MDFVLIFNLPGQDAALDGPAGDIHYCWSDALGSDAFVIF
jgi:hypothetical protein